MKKIYFVTFIIFVGFFFWIGNSLQCHPECRYQCNDVVWPADCRPVYEEPKCEYSPEEFSFHVTGHKPNCSVYCPEDQCEMDMCPQCEIRCNRTTPSHCPEGECQILCEMIMAGWYCQEPEDMPPLDCRKQCEQPACQTTAIPTTPFTILPSIKTTTTTTPKLQTLKQLRQKNTTVVVMIIIFSFLFIVFCFFAYFFR